MKIVGTFENLAKAVPQVQRPVESRERSPEKAEHATPMSRFAEILLSLVIVGSVLDFGGVQPLAYSLAELALFAGVLIVAIAQTRRGKIKLPLPIWLVLFFLFVGLQTVPLPFSILSRLSPHSQLAYVHGAPDVVSPGWIAASVNVHETLLALMKFLGYCCAFTLAAYCFDSTKRKSLLLRTLVLLGIFEAVYGIVQYLTGWQKIFTYTKQYYRAEATGTYINHNHFAGFLELTMPLLFAVFFYNFEAWSRGGLNFAQRRGVRGTNAAGGAQTLAYSFLLALIGLAIIFSRSRAGILAALISLICIAVLAQLKTQRKTLILGVLFFFGCVVGYGLWIGLGPVLDRFEKVREPSALQMQGRISLWKDTLGIIRDYPIVGSGLGTFPSVFRGYQTTLLDFNVDHAHSDYLEFASETGLIGFSLLFLPIFYLFVKMIISFLDDPRLFRRTITLGCTGGTLALLIHSAADFNLQIPANALTLAVLLGVGYKAACIERRAETPTSPKRLATPRKAAVVN
jgi:O-antigen ligase